MGIILTKLIKERINVVDPNWKASWYDKYSLFGAFPDYIRNEKVTKLFEEFKVLRWQIDGGDIWMEIN